MKYSYMIFYSKHTPSSPYWNERRFIFETYKETKTRYMGRILYCSDSSIRVGVHTIFQTNNKKLKKRQDGDSVEELMKDNFEDFL